MAMNTNFKAFIGVEKGSEGYFVPSDSEIQDYSGSKPIPKYTSITLGTMYPMNGDPNYIVSVSKARLYNYSKVTLYIVQHDKKTIDFFTASNSIGTKTSGNNTLYIMGFSTSSVPRSTAAYIGAYFSNSEPTNDEVNEVMKPYVVADGGLIADTPKVKHGYTEYLTHCTSSLAGQTTVNEGDVDITFTANSGYEFDTTTNTGSYEVGDSIEPTSVSGTFKASDKHQFTTTIKNVNGDLSVDMTANAIKVAHNVKTNNISYCTVDAPTTVEDGETLNVVITPNSGYEFSKDGTWYEGDSYEPNSVEHPFTPTGKTYTLSIPNVKTDIDVWLDATKQNVVPETVTYVEHLSHCTSSHTGGKINKGSTDITFTADEGYEFSTKGTWFQQSDPSMPEQTTDFFPTDKHQFTVTLEYVYAPVTVTLSATSAVVTSATAFNNLYLTNDGELGNLATERFYEEKTGDNTVNVDIIDYGKQILNLLRLPFAIPEVIQGTEKKPIQLGNKKTTVESTPILSDTVKVNVGKITVPETYKNVIDYRYTDCVLHLPFVDEMKLDIEYTIGYTITIYYLVNLYTGKATLILSTSKTGNVFHTETISIGQKLPFIQLADNSDYSSMGTTIYTGIKQAYIDVISQPPVENATMRVNEHGKLKDYTGYTEASTIMLTTSATVSEQEDIKQLLNQGVYINDTTTIH